MRITNERYKGIREGLEILENIDNYLASGVEYEEFEELYDHWTKIAKILQAFLQEGIEDGKGGEE